MEDHREKRHTSYQLQTKLYHVEDTLVSFSSLSLTLRQCFVLMLGGCASIQVWHMLAGSLLLGMPLLLLLLLTGIPSVLALLLAMVRIADRYGEDWAGVLLQYVLRSRLSLWQPTVSHLPHAVHSPGKRPVQYGDDQDEQSKREEGA